MLGRLIPLCVAAAAIAGGATAAAAASGPAAASGHLVAISAPAAGIALGTDATGVGAGPVERVVDVRGVGNDPVLVSLRPEVHGDAPSQDGWLTVERCATPWSETLRCAAPETIASPDGGRTFPFRLAAHEVARLRVTEHLGAADAGKTFTVEFHFDAA